MILDRENMLSIDQDLSQTASTYYSTDILDLGNAKKGEGQPIEMMFEITEDFVGATATLQIGIETSIDEAFSSPILMYDTGALAVGVLLTTYRFPLRVLPNEMKQYMRMRYIIAVATTTAGLVSAGLVKHLQTNY